MSDLTKAGAIASILGLLVASGSTTVALSLTVTFYAVVNFPVGLVLLVVCAYLLYQED